MFLIGLLQGLVVPQKQLHAGEHDSNGSECNGLNFLLLGFLIEGVRKLLFPERYALFTCLPKYVKQRRHFVTASSAFVRGTKNCLPQSALLFFLHWLVVRSNSSSLNKPLTGVISGCALLIY